MAENIRIILKSDEIFKSKLYKINPEFVNTPIYSSLLKVPNVDSQLVIEENDRMVASVYIDVDDNSFTISYLNDEINNGSSILDNLNDLRDNAVTYSTMLTTNSELLEKIPTHLHAQETVANYNRLSNEYPEKKILLDKMVTELFDVNYATNMHMVGIETQISLDVDKLDVSTRMSGYIKVENAPSDIALNFMFRGIPVPMRRTLTSINGTKYRYIFTYPQYLIDNIDMIQAIQYIEVNNPGSATFWYGNSYDFKLADFAGYGSKLANLHMINNVSRNLNGQGES